MNEPGDTDPDRTAEFSGATEFPTEPMFAGVTRKAALGAVQFHPTDGIGTSIGPYRLVRRLGEGGMGVVYLAEQQSPIRRDVALKIIKPGVDSAAVIARFEAERQSLALMDHSHIVRVFDAGTTGSGRPYFVMELVQGVPITRYCDENRLSPDGRLKLFQSVCEAVQHAHQKGIIHRDLKPGNVLVATEGGQPVAKVIDFGVAKALHQPLAERMAFTQLGAIVGTPQYMSPEQAGGALEGTDTRSDVYALGVILYELLTGATPLAVHELREATYARMMQVIQELEPPKPSTRVSSLDDSVTTISALRQMEPRRLAKFLAGDLDCIVMKCLEKDRGRRYQTVNGLERDIALYLSGEAITARPGGLLYQLGKFTRRHRVLVGSVAAVALALMLGIAGTTLGMVRARRAQAAADQARTVADQQRALAVQQRNVANQQRHDAEVNLAEGGVLEGDALLQAGRFTSARQKYENAWNALEQLGAPTFHAELGMWQLQKAVAFPALIWEVPPTFVEGMALSRDGRTAMTANGNHGVGLWNLQTGDSTALPAGDWVTAVAISPDSRIGISGANLVVAWDLASRTPLWQAPNNVSRGSDAMAISPDGQSVIVGDQDHNITIYAMQTGQLIHRLTGHTAEVRAVGFSADGKTALSGSLDGTLRLWDLVTFRQIKILPGERSPVLSAALSPDGKMVLSGGPSSAIVLRDVGSGRAWTLGRHPGPIDCIAFSPDGTQALSAGGGVMKLWDLATRGELRTFVGHEGRIRARFGPEAHTAITAGADNTIRTWDLAPGSGYRMLKGHFLPVNSIALSADGRLGLSGSWDNTVRLWDIASGVELRVFSGHTQGVSSVALSRDGHFALSGGWDRSVRFWDVTTGKLIVSLEGHDDGITCVALRGSALAASGGFDGVVKLWDLDGRKELRTIKTSQSAVNCVAISPDGRFVLSAGDDGYLNQWDVASGQLLRAIKSGDGPVRGLAILSDGRSALTGGDGALLQLWDLSSGTQIRALQADSSGITAVAATDDAKIALTASRHGTVTLWSIDAAREIRVLDGGAGLVCGVALSADGRTALWTLPDKTIAVGDFDFSARCRRFQPVSAVAGQPLNKAAVYGADPAALGEYELLAGRPEWAASCFQSALAAHETVSPIELARCYEQLGRVPEAQRELKRAMARGDAPQFYLQRCVDGLHHAPAERPAAQSSDELRASIDATFGEGFGKLKFGMSSEEAWQALYGAGADLPPEQLFTATEFHDHAMQYIWQPLKRLHRLTHFASAHWDLGYLNVLFDNDKLVAISFDIRFDPEFPTHFGIAQDFAAEYGIPVSRDGFAVRGQHVYVFAARSYMKSRIVIISPDAPQAPGDPGDDFPVPP